MPFITALQKTDLNFHYPKHIRILITGDREWKDEDYISRVLASLTSEHLIIEGAAAGVDTIAGKIADKMGLLVAAYPAEWTTHHRAAGPIRNRQMLKEGQPHLVYAFHPNLQESRGTKDMCKASLKLKLPVFLYDGFDLEGQKLALVKEKVIFEKDLPPVTALPKKNENPQLEIKFT